MTIQHTPEPWVIDEREDLSTNFYSDDVTGSVIGGCPEYKFATRPLTERQANVRRIVARVNACRGLPTDELEQKGLVAAVGTQLLEADQLRDELLAALEFILDDCSRMIPMCAEERARAAIAKAKGGAA